MQFHDITVSLSENTPIYPGDPKLDIESWKSLANGDSANVTYLRLGAHTGTHVDAPAHFISDAAKVDSIPLDSLIGPAAVVEVPDSYQTIDEEFVGKNVLRGTERVLFKTRNSKLWSEKASEFQTDFTHLSVQAANYLVQLGIKLVGIDYLSIEKFRSVDHETHLSLLSKGIVILEGLNLTSISPGTYELICLPLKVSGALGDGAPARAVLGET
jgi:arylformamidase